MKKCIIAAVAEGGEIGRNGSLPWHISEDLQYFKNTTSGYPVIMGRKTYESIGRPLPGRLNIVLHGPGSKVEGAFGASSFEDAYGLAYMTGKDKCFVIGGASVYQKAMADADSLYITHIHTSVPDADAWFPSIDPDVWKLVSKSETKQTQDGIKFEFAIYERTVQE